MVISCVYCAVPVAARSEASVCGRSPAEIVGSNPIGGMDVCRECCVFSGSGLCDELTTRPEESYRRWRVFECDLETWLMRRPWPGDGCAKNKQTYMVYTGDLKLNISLEFLFYT